MKSFTSIPFRGPIGKLRAKICLRLPSLGAYALLAVVFRGADRKVLQPYSHDEWERAPGPFLGCYWYQ